MDKTAAELKPGQKGTIEGFNDASLSLQLLEMGCLPGSEIQMKFYAPLGDPVCMWVSGYNLSLRKAEAANIKIKEGINES